MKSRKIRSKKKASSRKKYRTKRKVNIPTNSIASFGRQFGDEFGRVLSSGYRTTRDPVVKYNRRKRNR